MKKVIGIISYLPDDEKLRRTRKAKLELLLAQCNSLFYLPIIIIAQNWDGSEAVPVNCIIYHYDKLGITGARRELRKRFLESEYDYLIMLDDDCNIIGTAEQAKQYLDLIDLNPGKFGTFKGTLFKLFAISKEIFQQEDFPELEAEKGEIFEDIYFVGKLRRKYPQSEFDLNRSGLMETSDSAWDENSTWFHYQYNKREIGDKTRALLRELDSN